MASKAFRHVVRRGVYFQYNRRVPAAVMAIPEAHLRLFKGQSHFRRSLPTSDQRTALRLAAEAEDEFVALIAQAGSGSGKLVNQQRRRFSAEALADVSSYIRDRLIVEWRKMILRAEISEEDADYLEMRLDRIVSRPQGTDEMSELLGGSPRERATEINASWGFGLDEGSDDFAELVMAVKDGCVAGRKGVQDLFLGKSLPDDPTSTLINRFGRPKAKRRSKLFSELSADRRKSGDFADSTRVKMQRAHEFFVKVVGDKSIGDITRDDVRSFLDVLAKRQVCNRPITRETLQSYLTQISSPLTWAIERGWMGEPNPAKGFKLSHWASSSDPQARRRRFSVGELNNLLAHPWFKGCASPSDTGSHKPGAHLLGDVRYWAPVVALYTGGRASELAGLKLTDIKLEDSHPHILIQANDYRGIKSGNRHVPVLEALLKLGFGEYIERVRATGSDRLFPDWEKPSSGKWASAKWIKSFNRTVIPAVFPEASTQGHKSPLVFHSLRGAFKVLLLNSGHRHLANAVIGHVQDDLDKSYIGTLTPAETYVAFHAVNFTGLKIPTRA